MLPHVSTAAVTAAVCAQHVPSQVFARVAQVIPSLVFQRVDSLLDSDQCSFSVKSQSLKLPTPLGASVLSKIISHFQR